MDLASLIRRNLSSAPKTLPPELFYDGPGSKLFEEITRLPEYYLTRTEHRILAQNASEILRRANGFGPLSVVELGAGSARKTEALLAALARRQGTATYIPVDVSEEALRDAQARLATVAGLSVRPQLGDNRAVLQNLPASGPARLILFIGSSIGNLDPVEATGFLRDVAATMRPQDAMLLGTDLVKEAETLHRAYNDSAGVTARFNLNTLEHLNREFGANFDVGAYEHHAFYNESLRRVEMHLVSQRAQTATIASLRLDVEFAKGESIHTENSHKYRITDVQDLAESAGLSIDVTWTDEKRWFAVSLLRLTR